MPTLFQHTRLLLHLFTIATPPPLETLVEVHLRQPTNTSLIITVFKNTVYRTNTVSSKTQIDNTVIVDVFPLNTMTQAQVDLQKQAQSDLQNQLEQATVDLTTRPLLNDSPVLYIETSDQKPPTVLEQMEHTKVEHENPKTVTPHDDTDHTQATPPPPKKRYEIMKDPVFLSPLNHN